MSFGCSCSFVPEVDFFATEPPWLSLRSHSFRGTSHQHHPCPALRVSALNQAVCATRVVRCSRSGCRVHPDSTDRLRWLGVQSWRTLRQPQPALMVLLQLSSLQRVGPCTLRQSRST